jgi:signal transduction histidine kinase
MKSAGMVRLIAVFKLLKSALNLKGNQRSGVDYAEPFSPTLQHPAKRMETPNTVHNRVALVALKYGIAAVAVTLALLITQSLQPTVFPTPLFFAAIVVSTWFGGIGPGIFAVVFATLLLDYYFVSATRTFAVHPAALLYLAQFSLPALLSSWFVKKRKDAEQALKEARDQLDVKVQQRTGELRQANQQLQSEIAERQRAEEAFHKTQSDLAHLTRVMTMSELATSIAHEVNQPLAAIVTTGDACARWLALDPPNLGRARESVARMITEGSRASEVVKRIRGLSKKTTFQKSALQMNELVHEVVALLDAELVKNKVRLSTELDPDQPLVFGDRVQLQQRDSNPRYRSEWRKSRRLLKLRGINQFRNSLETACSPDTLNSAVSPSS